MLESTNKPGVCVRLAEGEVDLIVGVLKVIVEGQGVIVLRLMMVSYEGGLLEGNIAASFEPSPPRSLMLSDGEDWNLHTLVVERSIFDDVEDIEPSDAWK